MKTSKYLKYVAAVLITVVGAMGLTSCLDLTQITQSKEKIVQVIKTTDAILTKSIASLDTIIGLVKGTTVEAKVTETATKVKSALLVVQNSVQAIAKLLQIDLTAVQSQDDKSLDDLVDQLEKQVKGL